MEQRNKKTAIEWSAAAWKLRCIKQNRQVRRFMGTALRNHMSLMYNLQATYNLANPKLFDKKLSERLTLSTRRNQEWIRDTVRSYERQRRQQHKDMGTLDDYFDF